MPALHYSFRIDSCISTHQFILPQIFHQPLVFFQHLQQYRRLKIWLGKVSGSTLWHGFLFCKGCCSKELPFLQRLPSRNQPFSQRLLFQGNHLFCKSCPQETNLFPKGCCSKEITFFAKDAVPRKSPFLQRLPSPLFQRLYHSTSQQKSLRTKPNSCRRKLSKSILTLGFLTWWYPQIINFNRVFLNKPSILVYMWRNAHLQVKILKL